MEKLTFDPGFTEQYRSGLRRIISKDGRFNVRRRGATWRDAHPYLYLINAPWPFFLLLILAGYLVANFVFAIAYYLVGTGSLHGAEAATALGRFTNAFFFSAHTLTTVGYGNIYPQGIVANSLAAFEALVGLMAFALATGLLFGRFSRPAARLAFSQKLAVAPYRDGQSLQFRVANRRSNNLLDVRAWMLLATVEGGEYGIKRKYTPLALERPSVLFLPLTWTVVHPIDDSSPLRDKTAADLARMQAEFLILIAGFDDASSQVLHARYSYLHNEVAWGTRFAPAFEIDESGNMVLQIDRLGEMLSPT